MMHCWIRHTTDTNGTQHTTLTFSGVHWVLSWCLMFCAVLFCSFKRSLWQQCKQSLTPSKISACGYIVKCYMQIMQLPTELWCHPAVTQHSLLVWPWAKHWPQWSLLASTELDYWGRWLAHDLASNKQYITAGGTRGAAAGEMSTGYFNAVPVCISWKTPLIHINPASFQNLSNRWTILRVETFIS